MTHDQAIAKIMPMGKMSRANGKGFTSHLSFYEVGAGIGKPREFPDVIFFRNDGVTDLIEVKVERTDFLRDKKKAFRKDPDLGMGTYRYYACPEHLIEANDLPDNWGLIWIPEKGKPYFKVKSAKFKANYEAERNLLFSLMRRCNNHFPLERCVEYDKIVTKQNNAVMKSDWGALARIKEVRLAFWEKMQKLIKYSRN